MGTVVAAWPSLCYLMELTFVPKTGQSSTLVKRLPPPSPHY